MPQPFNYLPESTVPNPTQNLISAVATGQGIQQLKAAQVATSQAEANFKQQQALQADLAKLSENPTPAAIAQMTVKHPQLSEHFKRSYDMLGAEQQKARVGQASEVYAALTAGDNELARERLQSQAKAYENSGMGKEAKTLNDLAELIKLHPETAQTSTALFLSSAMGPEKFTETFSKLESERRERGIEPSKLTEAQSAARTAATKADFAASEIAVELQKKGWDMYKIQEDVKIAKENNRIAALKTGVDKESNDLKRQELQDKLNDAKLKRDQAVRDRVAEVDSARQTIDNSLSTIDRLLLNPGFNDVVGAVEGSSFYPTTAAALVTPFTSSADDRANAIADFETIKSQTFLNQLLKLKNESPTGASGLGALSEEEGERLVNGVQNMGRKQGEKQARDNLTEVQRLLMKSRKGLVNKFGVPDTIPDTPQAQPTPEEIDGAVKKYGG
jgi:hypothetical protein